MLSPATTNRRYALFFLITTLIFSFGLGSTCSAETGTSIRPGNRSSNLENRIKLLERQIEVLNNELGRSRTVYNILIETKQLASDSWNIAVEARTIAMRAEEKADRLEKEKARKTREKGASQSR